MSEFTVKDSGERQQFASGMVRDVSDGKVDFLRVYDGPMLKRWAEHLTRAVSKYPDVAPGVPNWTLTTGSPAEQVRAKASAARHFYEWLKGENSAEDVAAAVFFNINLFEYGKLKGAE